MNQKKKNIALIIVLGLLILSSFIIGLTDETGTSTIENSRLFAVQDTSTVDLISIASKTDTIKLKKDGGTWMLNDKYKAEQNIVKVLLSILRDAEVVRNVPKTQAETRANDIKENGYLVEISGSGENLQTFYTTGNDNKTVSYIMPENDDTPYIVNIPGYESYVAGIYEIPLSDWRDRTIMSTNWRTLQKMDVKYHQYPEYNFTIQFKFNFLNVEGVNNLDTARMMSYVEQFNQLQADRYLSKGENEKYDSLLQTPETVSMTIADISQDNSKTLQFYPLLPDDPMMLGYVKEDEQMVLFQANRIQSLFAVKDEFALDEAK